MNRRTAVFALSFLIVPVFAADELPKAETLMDRYIEVTGGKAAYEKRKSEIVTGRLEFSALGIKGKMTRYAAEPDKYYSSTEIDQIGKVDMGVNGDVAWENSALLGPRIKSGEEKAQSLREARLNAVYHWREMYPKVETVGMEDVEGKPCYKVVATPKEGKPETMFFEKDSGLLKKTLVVAASQMGDVQAEIIASEYRDFGGILVPVKATQKAAGQEFSIIIENVTPNPQIPPDKFELPDAIKALVNKK